MRSSLGPALLVATGVVLWACSDASAPALDGPSAPDSVVALPVDLTSVRVTWSRVEGAGSYRVERRPDLSGAFEIVARDVPALTTAFLDTGLVPETFYGYRVIARSSLGDNSRPSTVVGVRTPPIPGINVVTRTSLSTPQATDADGYLLIVQGPVDTTRLPIDLNEDRRVSPLPAGTYTVMLQGLAVNCVADSLVRNRIVTDQGTATLQQAVFNVSCQDPEAGRMLVTVAATGDSLDADGYVVTVTGIPDDGTIPVVSRSLRITAPEGAPNVAFDNLPAGAYSVELSDLAANCTVAGGTRRDLRVEALRDTTTLYELDCPATGQSTRPFVWTNQWIPASQGTGQAVELDVILDLTADPVQTVGAVQAEVGYNPAVVRYDSILPDRLNNIVDNGATPGKVTFGAFTTSAGGRAGLVRVARLFFTVTGSSGQTTRTQSLNVQASSSNNDGAVRIDTLIRVSEATLTVGSGPGNQSPVPHANGPYTGTTGNAITFTSAGSSDPDGTINNYLWVFGDGGSATGPAPSHAYTSAGTYTVTLTVTDNLGATGQSQTTATVTSGGGNLPPVAQANGPYTGASGAPISFSAAGSSDPDGSIANYQWSFGDNGTATGASASHTYSSAGGYTVTLTVSDNLGATGTAQTTATVSGPSPTPFTWSGQFGAINPADSLVSYTITMDLSGDIPETPGSEALQSWTVDSLKWDPAVLKYFSFNFGPGGFGSVDPTFALSQGRLVFNGSQPAANSTGIITVATVRFKVIGPSSSTTTTITGLGNLIGTAATGGFNYRSKTAVQEGTIIAP